MKAASAERRVGLDEGWLRRLFAEGRRRAERRGQAILVSATTAVPRCDALSFYERGASLVRARVFWSSPNAERTVAGVGEAATLTVGGPSRFADAAIAWRNLTDGMLVDAETDALASGPVALGGFAFDPLRPTTELWRGYPAGLLTVPRYVLTATAGQAWLTVNALVWPDGASSAESDVVERVRSLLEGPDVDAAPSAEHPPRVDELCQSGEWKELVRTAVERIRHGELEKVVLARACHARAGARLSPSRVLRRLREDYPGCFLFAIDRGERCFLGASPEQLVSLGQGTVQTMCLAGSTARGATAEDDRRLGDDLLASAKNRSEHAIVARGIRERLAGAGVDVGPIGPPTLLRLRNIQHLYTPIVGRVTDGRGVLDLIALLHPTPSVGGQPRDVALRLIREREGLDRGWYTGPIGWVDGRGQGEFTVAIRSALLSGAEATVFAGCGIVADSDPESEFAESCLKLKPILSALGEG